MTDNKDDKTLSVAGKKTLTLKPSRGDAGHGASGYGAAVRT